MFIQILDLWCFRESGLWARFDKISGCEGIFKHATLISTKKNVRIDCLIVFYSYGLYLILYRSDFNNGLSPFFSFHWTSNERRCNTRIMYVLLFWGIKRNLFLIIYTDKTWWQECLWCYLIWNCERHVVCFATMS